MEKIVLRKDRVGFMGVFLGRSVEFYTSQYNFLYLNKYRVTSLDWLGKYSSPSIGNAGHNKRSILD